MPTYETYKKRTQKAAMAGQSIAFQYDQLPRKFRVQVVYIWEEVIGVPVPHPEESYAYINDSVVIDWNSIHNPLARELGLFDLGDDRNSYNSCVTFLLNEDDVDSVLSLIEFSFRSIEANVEHIAGRKKAEKAIEELNQRFLEHHLGYQYHAGQIVQMDSEYLHSNAVEPAIFLLSAPGFEGPLQEFLQAHKHYRARDFKEAITQASNSFESTMKAICDQSGWSYDEGWTTKKLIGIMFEKALVPSELQSHFSGLRNVLSDAVSTLRNRKGGHGQGSQVVDVPDYLTSYVLNLTASNIVFLVEAYKDSK